MPPDEPSAEELQPFLASLGAALGAIGETVDADEERARRIRRGGA